MPAPKQDLKTSNPRFKVPKDNFTPAPGASQNWGIYWSAEGTEFAAPFAWEGRHYQRIAYGYDLDKLALYVDKLEQQQRTGIEAIKEELKEHHAEFKEFVNSENQRKEENTQHSGEFEHCKSALDLHAHTFRQHSVKFEEHAASQKQHKNELESYNFSLDALAQTFRQHTVKFEEHIASQKHHKDEFEHYKRLFDSREQTFHQQTVEFEAVLASQKSEFVQVVADWQARIAVEVKEQCLASRGAVTASVRSSEAFILSKLDVRTERIEAAMKTFGDRLPFLSAYSQTSMPVSKDEFFVDMDRFVLSFARDWGSDDQVAREFCRELRRDCEFNIAQRPVAITEIQYVAARFWTSVKKLRNSRGEFKEPSGMLNHATRMFSKEVMVDGGGLRVHRAINTMCNLGRQDGGRVPPGCRTFRGAGIPRSQLIFWKKLMAAREEYRVPFALATTENFDVTTRFLQHIPANSEPTRFTILFTDEDGSSIPCVHVNYLERVSTAKNEAEWLFSAFSTFMPLSVQEQELPTAEAPHEITLRASRDNLHHSEYLLLAEWH